MMDTDTSVIQERIGQLCREFKLPTMGTQSVVRFTESGHGDALPTFHRMSKSARALASASLTLSWACNSSAVDSKLGGTLYRPLSRQ